MMYLFLVGLLWGVTNPLIKKGSAGVSKVEGGNVFVRFFKDIKFFVTNWKQKPMCHFNLGKLMDVQERHITNRLCRDSGVHGQFDRSSLLWEMTVGVYSLTSEVLGNLTKGMPPPAYFDWRGWFRAGLPFFQGDMTLRCSALILPHGSR
ncbi:hypothetical protein J6590_058201 [Homalodisca vitripennis]|nr:hypothetical protein J6590_058201 [Homalodisca vitripennis]